MYYDDSDDTGIHITDADVYAYMKKTGRNNTRLVYDPYTGEYVEVPVVVEVE